MIVELVGLPGSGKSTFARTLEKGEKWKRARTTSRTEVACYAFLFFVRHPLSAFRQLSWLLRYCGHPRLWYTKFVNLFLVHNAKYMKASYLAHAVIDQGHLQNIMSLFDTTVSLDVVRKYLAILPRPDVYIFFDVNTDERERRMSERGYGVREGGNEDARAQWQVASEKHFTLLCEIERAHMWTSFIVREDSAGEVLKKLEHFRLWRFVMHLRMPTEKAHGLQIAKTLEAMTLRGEMVELWVPARKNIITEDIFTYYSLTAHFPVRAITSFAALRFVRVLGSIAYWLDALAFLVALAMERIETESVYYTRSAPVAWLLAQKGAHVYFEAHLWPNTKEKVFRALLRGVSLVVANSDGTREMFRKNGFVNTVVIRNGADFEKFALSISHHDARKKLNLNLDENIIMYVGSFARWKGVATLYAAWVKIQKQFPDTRLVLVGGEKNTLAQFDACGDIDQNDRVTVLPHQQAALVPTYLRAANVLVLPNEAISEESIRYTSPIKLFEYMASGRPIIVSDLPAMHEVLDDTTSTFFEAGNSDDLAIKLSYALTHGAEGESRAKMASVNAEEFSWQKRAQQLSSMVKN